MNEQVKDQAFMFVVKLTEIDHIEEKLIKYCKGKYLLVGETKEGAHTETNGEHFHIWCQMSDKDYHKFSKVIKDKYKLTGRATVGKSRMYGKISKIKSLEKLKIYMMKDQTDNEMVRTNMKQEEIETLRSKSYKKPENREKWAKLQAIAHKLIIQKLEESNYQSYYDNQSYNEILYGEKIQEKYEKNDESKIFRMNKQHQVEWLGQVNKAHRELNDGLPMTKNTMLKLLFKFEQLEDEEYINNMMRYI